MRNSLFVTGVLAALLAATPAFSQTSGGTAPGAERSSSTPPAASAPADSKSEMKSNSQSATTSGGTAAGSGATTSSATTGSTSAASGKAIIETQERDHLTAQDLIGAEVRNPQDEKIGKIEDLVLDANMQVVGVVVSVGGFLGMGEHNVALTRDQVDIKPGEDRNERLATVSMTKDELKAAPEFKTLEQQQAEAEQERARQQQGTAAGAGARPPGAATTPPSTRTQ